jgi:hypothetical protein
MMASNPVPAEKLPGQFRLAVARAAAHLILLAAVAFVIPSRCLAQEVKLPAVNLGDTSFEDGFGVPGWLVQEFPDIYVANELRDDNGNEVPGSNGLSTYTTTTHVAYVSTNRVLGGWLALEGLETLADVALKIDGTTSRANGFADLEFGPGLQWAPKKIGAGVFVHRLMFDLSVPTGSYSDKQPVNIGNHFVVLNPYYAATYEISKIEFSARFHYLWNSTNNDPFVGFDLRNSQAGQAFHVNYSASYEAWENVRIGFNGYWLQELTDDRINGLAVPNSRERTVGLGPGLQIHSQNIWYNLHAYQETDVRNRFSGWKVAARITLALPAG